MIAPAVDGCGGVADHGEPGDLIRLVADGLTVCGLEARLSDPKALPGSTSPARLGSAVQAVGQ
jgi:hypothetical protein